MKKIDSGLHYPLDMNALSKTWSVSYIGDVAIEIQPGFASGEHNQEGTGIPHVRPMNINRQGNLDLSVVKYVSPDRDKKRLRAGDVLFNNTNSPELIGKTTVINKDNNWAFSNHMTRIVFPQEVSPKFVAYQLHFLWSMGYFLHKCVKHVNQASISSKTLGDSVPLILAPFNEQTRIVSEIEKKFSRLDEAVAALKRVRASLKRYKASVLKSAVEGKLTEEWRKQNSNVEPADKLLKRILTARKKKWEEKNPKKKYKEPVAPDTLNLPELPKGWVWVTVGQLCIISSGQTPKGIDKVSGKGTIPWFRVGDMNTTGNEKFMNVAEIYLTESEMEKLRLHTHSKGMIIFPKRGGAIATNKKRILSKPSTYDLNTMGLLPIVTQFEYFWNWFLSIDLGKLGDGSNVPQINNKDIEPLIVPLPPFSEQEKIATEVERRLSVIGEVDKEIDTNLKRAERLRQSILKKAFSGKLVPQDPNEKSTSKLLEKINMERET